MEMKPGRGSNIHSHGYDPARRILAIVFHSDKNKTYRWSDVPPDAYEEFESATSMGRHFYQKIQGKYQGIRPEEDDANE